MVPRSLCMALLGTCLSCGSDRGGGSGAAPATADPPGLHGRSAEGAPEDLRPIAEDKEASGPRKPEKPEGGNVEYAKKLEATKDRYPFARWRKAFDDGLEQYTEENCARARAVFDRLLADLTALGPDAGEKEKVACFRDAILALNRLNEELDEEFIETGEREDLCELVDVISRAAGLDPSKYGGGEGLASEWREW